MTDQRTLILVLGTQRSGTSLLTRALNLRGCALPGELLAANAGNPTGYWENARAVAIDEDLLRALGRGWDDPRALPADWMQGDAATVARGHIARLLDEQFAGQALSLLKDPRLCLLAPLWIEVATAAGFDVRVVVCLRDPREVAASLARFSGMDAAQAKLLWLRQVVAAEACSRGLPRALARHDRLLADAHASTENIGRSLGLAWPASDDASRRAIEAFVQAAPSISSDAAPPMLDGDPADVLYAALATVDGEAAWRSIASAQDSLDRIASYCDPLLDRLHQMADAAALRVAEAQAQAQRDEVAVSGHRELIAAQQAVLDARNQQIVELDAQLAQARTQAEQLVLQLADANQRVQAHQTLLDSLSRPGNVPAVMPVSEVALTDGDSPPTPSRPLRRIAIYLFHDSHGIVDDYVVHMLRALQAHVARTVVVCNGAPGAEGIAKLEASGAEVFVRANTGFDVHGYREAIAHVGAQALAECDELLLLNYTFFGPIFPLAEMFDAMAAREVDFWGISAHAQAGSPFAAGQIMPAHIQTHFLAVRASLLHAEAFAEYWRTMPPITSYSDSIGLHETRFTAHFAALGYRWATYMDLADFGTDHPIFIEIDRTIERRCPILKRRAFFHDPLYHEAEAIDLRRAFDLVRAHSDYPLELIWRNLVRTAPPRTLYTNLELLDVLAPVRIDATLPAWRDWKLAALVHLYYPEMAAEIGQKLANVPLPLDVVVTTDSADKCEPIRAALDGLPNLRQLDVRVVASNAGRDTSALLIGCRDVVLDGGYDAIVRVHGKRSPQDGAQRAAEFRRHLLDNLLDSPGYVANLFDLLAREPAIGLLMPPVVQIGYPTLGHAWFGNRPRVQALADELGLRVLLDEHTPLAPLGSMFWFRPDALMPLFEKSWQWAQFEGESYGDGDLPHAIERLLPYCAQARGYLSWCAMSARSAARNYVKLEYRHQALSSCFPEADTRGQIATVLAYRDDPRPFKVRGAADELAAALRRSLRFRLRKLSGKPE